MEEQVILTEKGRWRKASRVSEIKVPDCKCVLCFFTRLKRYKAHNWVLKTTDVPSKVCSKNLLTVCTGVPRHLGKSTPSHDLTPDLESRTVTSEYVICTYVCDEMIKTQRNFPRPDWAVRWEVVCCFGGNNPHRGVTVQRDMKQRNPVNIRRMTFDHVCTSWGSASGIAHTLACGLCVHLED